MPPCAPDPRPARKRRRSHRRITTLLSLAVALGVAAAAALAVTGWSRLGAGASADAPTGNTPVPVGPPRHDAAVPGATPAAVLPFDMTAHSTTDPASPWVVVNKQHPLQPSYVPASLTTVAGSQVATPVVPDLTALLDAAAADGVHLTLVSGYRSYAYQTRSHRHAVISEGYDYAESVSARAGYSEHQTGLTMDFGGVTRPSCNLEDCFAGTAEGRWLAAHAAAFGFLLRYTSANTAITGYASEAWHYRWIGADLVAAMAARGVSTLEEFFGVSGGSAYAAPATP